MLRTDFCSGATTSRYILFDAYRDLATGAKTVKFEKVTVKKTVRHVTSTSSSSTSVRQLSTSRTPSEERILEDSAYVDSMPRKPPPPPRSLGGFPPTSN
ncbi:unnamed protein product [Acanthoscelides obtectus]|uniref:Uncharacterized protein n=1 Tax=Acanthoscelides obtectus TaxID=200917 RepID=A0A9P0K6R7_ACAOB|nr:unnamed protein product [Acanthoscelides obtectus]CAK1626745.1 hypothetical protein AOBTE_LOCUS4056 [Acanthoscelides obtectus]